MSIIALFRNFIFPSFICVFLVFICRFFVLLFVFYLFILLYSAIILTLKQGKWPCDKEFRYHRNTQNHSQLRAMFCKSMRYNYLVYETKLQK